MRKRTPVPAFVAGSSRDTRNNCSEEDASRSSGKPQAGPSSRICGLPDLTSDEPGAVCRLDLDSIDNQKICQHVRAHLTNNRYHFEWMKRFPQLPIAKVNCGLCGGMFAQYSLKQHIAVVHFMAMGSACEYCGKKVSRKDDNNMRRHLNTPHCTNARRRLGVVISL